MSPENKDRLLGIALVNVATFAWATNIILGRYVRGEIGPLSLTALRYVVASAVFAALLRRRPEHERRPGADLPLLAAMAATGVLLFAPILYLGLKYTTAVNGTLINGMGPLLTAIFAARLIREPFSGRQLAGSLAALAGVFVLISGASLAFFRGAAFNPGDLLIVLAVAVWALYSVAGRKAVASRSPLSATALSMFIGLPVLLAAALAESFFLPAVWSPKLVLVVLYIGFVPAALGFFCWNAGIKKLGAGGVMVFYNTLPLYGAFLGWLFLGESLGLPHFAGGALILTGGIVASVKKP